MDQEKKNVWRQDCLHIETKKISKRMSEKTPLQLSLIWLDGFRAQQP